MSSRASWMFDDHYPETFGQAGQALNMAVLRFYVIAIYKPLSRLLTMSRSDQGLAPDAAHASVTVGVHSS